MTPKAGAEPSDATVSVATLSEPILCGICGTEMPPKAKPGGSTRQHCSDVCRRVAWERTHPGRRVELAQRRLPLRWESRVERQFARWIESEDGRKVEAEVVRRALKLQERGFRRYGIAALVEAIRYDAGISLLGDGDYRINNNHRSLLARRVMRTNQDLAGFFETRDLRGRVA